MCGKEEMYYKGSARHMLQLEPSVTRQQYGRPCCYITLHHHYITLLQNLPQFTNYWRHKMCVCRVWKPQLLKLLPSLREFSLLEAALPTD